MKVEKMKVEKMKVEKIIENMKIVNKKEKYSVPTIEKIAKLSEITKGANQGDNDTGTGTGGTFGAPVSATG